MILKNGTHMAARVTPKGQNVAGYSCMLVIPKTEVTKVSGCTVLL